MEATLIDLEYYSEEADGSVIVYYSPTLDMYVYVDKKLKIVLGAIK